MSGSIALYLGGYLHGTTRIDEGSLCVQIPVMPPSGEMEDPVDPYEVRQSSQMYNRHTVDGSPIYILDGIPQSEWPAIYRSALTGQPI